MASELGLQKDDLDSFLEKYESLAQSARSDTTANSDRAAARIAPIVFLLDLKGFEATFDLVLHHYEEALKKADTEILKTAISRECEELFHLNIYALQSKIEDLKSKAGESFWEKMKKPMEKIFIGLKSVYMNFVIPGELMGTEEFIDGAIELMKIYIDKVRFEWKVKEGEDFFYWQIGNAYQKIILSNCYSGEFTLLQNTFSTNKARILPVIVEKKGYTAAVDLLEYSPSEIEKRECIYIIVNHMINKNQFEEILSLIPMVSKTVNNLHELKFNILKAYETSIRKPENNQSFIKSVLQTYFAASILFFCASSFMISGVVYLILQAFNVENSFGSFLAFGLGLAVGIPFILFIAQKIIKNQKVRAYRRRLENSFV